ncbi:MAG: adenylate/guanylate cyclase domain-containing protein [Spirochaetales bacterium]|nr:adenylate/guanylate cyclase domain-containing protein [Spirochaetales bacterium]
MNKKFLYTLLLINLCFYSLFFLDDTSSDDSSSDDSSSQKKYELVETLDSRTYLSHNWKFRVGDNKEFALPDYDDSTWERVDFPASNFPFDITSSNFFWFRKSFYVSMNIRGQALGYAAQKLPDATHLYFNGSLIGTSGSMPPDHYFGTSAIPRTYIIPEGLIRFGDKNVISMRVYTEKDAGDLKLPFITNNKDRLNDYSFQYTINVLIPMILFFLSSLVASYFLLMYLRNKEERFNLYICIAFFLISIYSTGLFIEDFPLGYLMGTKLWYTGLFLAQMFLAFFFQDFYRIHSNRIVKGVLAIITTACCIVLILTPSVNDAYFLINNVLFLALVSPINFYLLILTIYAVKKGNTYAKILLIGISLVVITASYDIIFVNLANEPPMWLTNTGVVLYILSMFLTSAYRFVDTKKEVDKLNIELTQQKNAFFRFVPTQFLSLLGKESAIDITLGDSSARSMSVLFSDIRKFTNLSEEMSPEDSFHLLNKYLLRMESPINANEGFVDKYVGDAIMALFSESPLEINENEPNSSADRAVKAAIGMRSQLDEFNSTHEHNQDEPLNMGIGINTGPLMLGTVGSTTRLDTTVIGDSVNLASRLEKLTQFYKASIIISEWTYQNITQPQSILMREIDLVIVKGRTEPCRIFEVFEVDPDDIKELKLKTRDILDAGMRRFKDQKFKEALTYFKEARGVFPNDIIPLLYIKRCVTYLKNPPPQNWSGVFRVHG